MLEGADPALTPLVPWAHTTTGYPSGHGRAAYGQSTTAETGTLEPPEVFD